MKKIVLIVMFLVLTILTGFGQTLGDVNNDNTVDIVDALLVAQYYVGLEVSEPFILNVADVDCNIIVDIVDALLIAQYYVGLLDAFSCSTISTPPGIPTHLKCEYLVNPLGIDNETPRFSWQLNDIDRGDYQSAYQIIVASTEANIDKNLGDLWDSGRVASSTQNGVKYTGTPLVSRSGYWWKVRVWDKDGYESLYSENGYFETAILAQSDWSAKWISGEYNLMRDDLELDAAKTISKARLYVTSLGYNEVYINGRKAGIDVCNPGFT